MNWTRNVLTIMGVMTSALITIPVWAKSPDQYLDQSMPDRWNLTDETVQSQTCSPGWWNTFNDPLLDSLINMGINNNYNLDMAARRIEIAGNNAKSARSGYLPTVGFDAGWTRTRNSGMTGGHPSAASTGSYWNAGLNLSWEIDLFGKITSRVRQQESMYKASRAEYEGAMVALAANIATDYVQLRVWQAERKVAIEHTKRQLRVVKITEDRLDCGLGNMLDVTQAREVYFSTLASLPGLENGIHTMINAIATLIGVYPEDLYDKLEVEAPLPDHNVIIPVGIPADLLRRRPDIVAAEQQLSAYADAVGIARKDFLPTLTINGSIGTATHNAGDLFDKRSFTYSIAPTLSWTIFDGLERKYNVAIAKEQLRSGIDNYNLTVMTAVQDVDNAISSYKSSLLNITAIEKVLEQSDKSLDLSLDLYKSSLTQFSNVVDAQMSVLVNQNSLIVARGDALMNIIKLYEAMGGGWCGLND